MVSSSATGKHSPQASILYMRQQTEAIMKSFFTGLALGFGAGVLFAPSKGEETRRSFRNKAESTRNTVSGKISGIREKISRYPDLNQRNRAALQVLNTIDKHQLLDVYAMNPALADRIIAGRPYSRVEQVVERGLITTTAAERFTQDLGAKAARRRA
jgi:gas vesicle protein